MNTVHILFSFHRVIAYMHRLISYDPSLEVNVSSLHPHEWRKKQSLSQDGQQQDATSLFHSSFTSTHVGAAVVECCFQENENNGAITSTKKDKLLILTSLIPPSVILKPGSLVCIIGEVVYCQVRKIFMTCTSEYVYRYCQSALCFCTQPESYSVISICLSLFQ